VKKSQLPVKHNRRSGATDTAVAIREFCLAFENPAAAARLRNDEKNPNELTAEMLREERKHAFHRRGVRQQSRLFGPRNPNLTRSPNSSRPC